MIGGLQKMSLTDGVGTPDLSSVLAKIDFNKGPLSHGRQGVAKGRFSVAKWGALAIELIAYPEEEDNILAEFGLTKLQYAELKGNKLFQAVWQETESTIVALATAGSFQFNARRVAEQSLNVLEEIIECGDDKDRLKAIELNARFASLDPIIQAKTKENAAVQTGVQLVVNFSNDLRVPSGFKQGSDIVIDTVGEVIHEER